MTYVSVITPSLFGLPFPKSTDEIKFRQSAGYKRRWLKSWNPFPQEVGLAAFKNGQALVEAHGEGGFQYRRFVKQPIPEKMRRELVAWARKTVRGCASTLQDLHDRYKISPMDVLDILGKWKAEAVVNGKPKKPAPAHRPPNEIIQNCALELSEVFRQHTPKNRLSLNGQALPKSIGELLQAAFPEEWGNSDADRVKKLLRRALGRLKNEQKVRRNGPRENHNADVHYKLKTVP